MTKLIALEMLKKLIKFIGVKKFDNILMCKSKFFQAVFLLVYIKLNMHTKADQQIDCL